MHTRRLASCLLALAGCSLVGCTQTGWLRQNSPSNMKSVASVGDKSLPIVAGEPGTGSTTRVESEQLDLAQASGSKISGRVFDERGRPVSKAVVRLVVNGAPAGKDNFATTERDGSFTLHGLRAGRAYTLIAESQGGDGMMSGRVEAHVPQSDVRIQVATHSNSSEPPSMSVRPARSRIKPNPDPDENDQDGFPPIIRPGMNADEGDAKDQSAEDQSSLAPRTSRKSATRMAATTSGSTTVRAGWNASDRAAGSVTRTSASRLKGQAVDADARTRRRSATDEIEAADDDGENPLPPAREAEDVAPEKLSGRRGDASASGPDEDTPSTSRTRAGKRRPSPVVLDPDDVNPEDVEPFSRQNAAEPRSIPDEVIPSAGGIAPASYAKTGRGDSDEDDEPPARVAKGSRRGTTTKLPPASRARKSVVPDDAGESSQDAQPDSGTQPPRRPTWRDLSIRSEKIPVDESVHQSSAEAPSDEPGQVRLASLRGSNVIPREVEPEQFGLPSEASNEPATDALDHVDHKAGSKTGESQCQIDTTDRRIIDFELPGLDGKMVSFRDIDADVILLDFWGSWCVQCRKSIAFERDLQAKLGSKRLKVVGIACEKGSTLAERRASAAKATKQLGITYPVLVSSMDAQCPLQKAFQVQFYPTMVVLDREGRILHIERGATDATLGRTQRTIATALKEAESRLE